MQWLIIKKKKLMDKPNTGMEEIEHKNQWTWKQNDRKIESKMNRAARTSGTITKVLRLV